MALNKMLKRPYAIHPYNPEWPLKFQKIKQDIVEIFGSKALAVEHVGSTAIPSMTSKGVIDVCVVIDHIESFIVEKQRMVEKGYQYEDEYIAPETILFYVAADDNEKIINIHVCPKDSYEAEKFIEGRDFMLAHPEWVERYKVLKEELYKKFPDDYPSYRAGKQDFLKQMKEQAHKEFPLTI